MHITLEQARTALHAVVAEHGDDYIYVSPHGTGCWNTEPDGKGGWAASCLVAKALERLGVDVVGTCHPEGYEVTDDTVNELRGASVYTLSHRLPGVTFDDMALAYLYRAQVGQDDGHPWGQVRDRADAQIRGEE